VTALWLKEEAAASGIQRKNGGRKGCLYM
jgi:hypothetical protein